MLTNNKSLTILGVSIFSCYYKHGFGWLRIFGKGIKWKDVTIYNYTFSERNGYSKGFTFYKWRIGFIR